MKVAKIGDIHFGLRQGSEVFQKNLGLFFTNVFFPALKQYNVTRVLQTGDMFDTRKQTHTQALDSAEQYFFDVLAKENIQMDMIVGNHDMYFRHTLSINTPDLHLEKYKNIIVHKTPKTIYIDNIAIDMIPWICDENNQEILDFVNRSGSDYCMAHLELTGFEMSKGYMCDKGMDMNLFKRYKQVWSGHFHRQSKNNNIHYLGSPSQHTFDDVGDIRGFHIFDTETKLDTFIPNPYNLFERIEYNEDEVFRSIDVSEKYVKIIIKKSTDSKKLQAIIDSLWAQNPIDIKTVDSTSIELDDVDYNITMENLEAGGFDIVPFLTTYTKNKQPNFTEYQNKLVEDTYKKLFDMSRESV